jgi:3-deoxy-manno-octulosonate cytidylyltransferase (CMP-KDO synthetase)
MKIVGIIPARYASTRFPGKPLIQIDGKSMICRVYEQACKASLLSSVMVATDDERIAQHLIVHNIPYVITSTLHASGTDRCAEVLQHLKCDAVINIQGDEPFIYPEQIDEVAKLLIAGAPIATLIKKVINDDELNNPNKPKVVVNKQLQALYFSRFAIPYLRNDKLPKTEAHTFYKHIGIYGYQAEVLKQITALPQSALECAESLEQLRWLENGFTIQCGITECESIAIDTPEDLEKISGNNY